MTTSIWANLDTENRIKRLDIWRESLSGVGRWNVLLDNASNVYGGAVDSEDAIELKIDDVSLMKGYVDDVLPNVSDKAAVCLNLLKLIGRDYGQDLANLQHTGNYYNDEADDIIDLVLDAAGSEITYVSPSHLAVSTGIFKDDYLINKFGDLVKTANGDFYVDDDKRLHVFPISTMKGTNDELELSNVLLYSRSGDLTDNILSLDPVGEQVGIDIRNSIKIKGRQVADDWSDGNASDLEGVNCDLTNETTLTVAGNSDIKGTVTANPTGVPRIDILFPKYNYDYLDFSEVGSVNCSVFVRHNADAPSARDIRVVAQDDEGHLIYYDCSDTMALVANTWKLLKFPVGPDNAVVNAVTPADKWWKDGGSAFTWKIVMLGIEVHASLALGKYVLMDGLSLSGVNTVAFAEEGAPWGNHRKRMITLSRPDIESQLQLQDVADDELAKRKDSLKKLKLVCSGQTGLKYAGQLVAVLAPSSGIGDGSAATSEGGAVNGTDFRDNTYGADGYDWVLSYVKILSGTCTGEIRYITAYDGAKIFTVSSAFTAQIVGSVSYELYATYRILSLHHAAEPHVDLFRGHDFITELELLKYVATPDPQTIDPLRFKLLSNPQFVQYSRLEDRVGYLEQATLSSVSVGSVGGGVNIPSSVYEKSATYLIRLKDGIVEAINGSTGAIDFSGTDLGTVTNQALTAAVTGLIFVRKAEYTYSTMIDLAAGAFLTLALEDGATLTYTGTSYAVRILIEMGQLIAPNAYIICSEVNGAGKPIYVRGNAINVDIGLIRGVLVGGLPVAGQYGVTVYGVVATPTYRTRITVHNAGRLDDVIHFSSPVGYYTNYCIVDLMAMEEFNCGLHLEGTENQFNVFVDSALNPYTAVYLNCSRSNGYAWVEGGNQTIGLHFTGGSNFVTLQWNAEVGGTQTFDETPYGTNLVLLVGDSPKILWGGEGHEPYFQLPNKTEVGYLKSTITGYSLSARAPGDDITWQVNDTGELTTGTVPTNHISDGGDFPESLLPHAYTSGLEYQMAGDLFFQWFEGANTRSAGIGYSLAGNQLILRVANTARDGYVNALAIESETDTPRVILSNGVKIGGTYYLTGLAADEKVLDSDKWDGYQFADYLNQPVKTNSAVKFGGATLDSGSDVALALEESTTRAAQMVYSVSANRLILRVSNVARDAYIDAFQIESETATPRIILSNGILFGSYVLSSLVGNNKISDSDLWDGYQFADYLNQAVKTTSNVQFGIGDFSGIIYCASNIIFDSPTHNLELVDFADVATILIRAGSTVDYVSSIAISGRGASDYILFTIRSVEFARMTGGGAFALAGGLTVGANQQLKVDHIAEMTGAHGIIVDNNMNMGTGTFTTGAIYSTTTYGVTVGGTNRDLYVDNTGLFGYVSSSIQFKENVRSILDAEWIYSLRPVMFDRKDGSSVDEFGLIVEEVAELCPNVVSFDVDELGNKTAVTVDYKKLIVPLIVEAKKLKADNVKIKKQLGII